MTLSEKYIREVQKYLPGKLKKEVGEEILDGIRQGMENGESEADVINGFGDPRQVAMGYAPQIGYLIGPELRFLYKRILGMTLLAVGIGLTVASFIGLLVSPEPLITFFLKLLGAYYQAGIMIFGTVTLIFFVINRQVEEDEIPSEGRLWHVEDLEKVPEPSERINLVGSLIGILFSIAGMILLVFYLEPNDRFIINLALVAAYRWHLLAVLLLVLCVEMALLIRRKVSNSLRILKLMSGITLNAMIIYVITREDFLNQQVIEGFRGSLAVVGSILRNVPLVTVAIILLVTFFEIRDVVKAVLVSKERTFP